MPKRTPAKPSPNSPFFANRLRGETPLSAETARALYQLARRLYETALWELLSGDDPFWIQPPTGAPVIASIMGSGGEIFGFKFNENTASQAFLLDILAGRELDVPAFLATRQILSLEFSWKKDLRPEDKAFLEVMGHPKSSEPDLPLFRSAHPGRPDWFLNEEEALRLRSYLEAILWLAEELSDMEIDDAFSKPDWPCIYSDESAFRLGSKPLPEPSETSSPVIPPTLLDSLLASLKPLPPKQSGALEIVAETSPITIGPISERPSFAHLVLICDAGTGFAFSPEMSLAHADPTEPILQALTMAFLERGALPTEVRHRKPIPVLKPFLDALGIAVKKTEELPACQTALASMRDFGVY